MRVEGSTGLAAEIDDATVRIGWREPDWLGPGAALPAAGAEWSIDAEDDVLVLTLSHAAGGTGIGSGTFATPAVGVAFEPKARLTAGCPEGMVAFGFQYTEFALPTRAGPDLDDWFLLDFRPPVVEPLLLIAPDLRTVLVAPLDWFHEQVIVPPRRDNRAGNDRAGNDRALVLGWHGDLDTVPAGFTTRMAFVPARDPVAAIDRWVALTQGEDAAPKPDPYRDRIGSHLSYWTDNGSAYWYRTEPPRSTPDTLVAAVSTLREQGVPVCGVQLDSWFYPHQVLRPFDTEEWVVPPSGLLRWEPREDILPDGIPALRRELGDPPLATHIRHLSSSSPYVDVFDCWVDGEQAHPTGVDYYETLLDQASAWGVEVLEHDWLVECYLGVRGLREQPGRARAWQEGLDRAAGERGMSLQWCMPTPADVMQTATLRNVTSIRTSGDHGYLVGPGILWSWFCYVNVWARAMGLWPYKDVFRTDHGRHDESLMEALLSALSGGPVGLGDRIGATDAGIVRATCRADGLLIKPDAPIAAIARCFARHVVMAGGHMVATTHSDHPVGRYVYAVAFNPQDRDRRYDEVVSDAELGVSGGHVVWDWRARDFVDAGEWSLSYGPQEWGYRVHCPRTPSGIAVIGDPDVFATTGRGRIRDITATAHGVRMRVLGAGETVTIVGSAPAGVSATAGTTGERRAVEVVARADRRFDLELEIGPLGWTLLELTV
ncbi:MAG: hypothetical protein QOK06_2410 [Acidimicrobiaceae bacterium]